jgi:ABC-2 type transport system ATP-binding protein
MIDVVALGMRYGARDALSDVSFTVGRGEVVGLLGPNGAGKTTTLRILTGALAPTAGDAILGGHSVRTHPLQVKQAVGYLPEGTPLYPDMRVGEYLRFRAALRGVPRRQRRQVVAEAVERCCLQDRSRQIIGTLSRGYRQRVGLADAVLAAPPILILDEPTVGLDPNQVLEMRALIRELGRDRAVLLSTHVLPDVEAMAARVVILDRGRVVASGSPAELRARSGGGDSATATAGAGAGGGVARVRVEVRPGDAEAARSAQAKVGRVRAIEGDGETAGGFLLTVTGDDRAAREVIAAALAAAGAVVTELRPAALPLEQVFARITTTDAGTRA